MKGGCHSSLAFCTDHPVSAFGSGANDDILHLGAFFFIFLLTIVYDLMSDGFVCLIDV
jgi:hypothetical protein